jgi:hypothetical protein
MPSMLGWALQCASNNWCGQGPPPFLCPRFRAGVCDKHQLARHPRVQRTHGSRFYALGFGLGFAMYQTDTMTNRQFAFRFYALGFGLGFSMSTGSTPRRASGSG